MFTIKHKLTVKRFYRKILQFKDFLKNEVFLKMQLALYFNKHTYVYAYS